MLKTLRKILCLVLLFFVASINANEKVSAYELLYNEQEEGTDVYTVRFTITDQYLRIDDLSDDSGYVLYDNIKKEIYSVSRFDKSVLVVPVYDYKKPDMSAMVKLEYKALDESPKISGKTVYNYRVSDAKKADDICMDIQLVPDLLPEATKVLREYQKLVAGQQAKSLVATPQEYQTTCFLYDQVFNDGKYYEKGLPIQEWHSNGKKRILTNYKKTEVDPVIFVRSDKYKEYSLF